MRCVCVCVWLSNYLNLIRIHVQSHKHGDRCARQWQPCYWKWQWERWGLLRQTAANIQMTDTPDIYYEQQQQQQHKYKTAKVRNNTHSHTIASCVCSLNLPIDFTFSFILFFPSLHIALLTSRQPLGCSVGPNPHILCSFVWKLLQSVYKNTNTIYFMVTYVIVSQDFYGLYMLGIQIYHDIEYILFLVIVSFLLLFGAGGFFSMLRFCIKCFCWKSFHFYKRL